MTDTTAQPATTKRAFKQRVHSWAQKLELPVVWLAVRPMDNKWASCSSNGHMHFSTDLLNLDPTLWDYVIVHELLHLTVPNHGKLFKALMRAHLGDWERAAARLQDYARSSPGSGGRGLHGKADDIRHTATLSLVNEGLRVEP
jgi:predicted metal-dependent hydrolase